jgi:hypothetical protein
MERPRPVRSVRAMFRKILIGYDEPERGGEATALAETLREPHAGVVVTPRTAIAPRRAPAVFTEANA